MKKLTLLTLFAAAACNAPTDEMNMNNGDVIEVASELSGDTSWTADKTYVLKGLTYMVNGTITIEPGTVIKGGAGAALIITQSAKINAVGTKAKPIVFTSVNDVGTRKAGDWGGIVLLGKASINTTGGSEIFEALPNDERGRLGGGASPDDTHDCGKLKYVRVEFGGYKVAGDKELNNISVCACGTKTEIDYVQSHRGSDDGIEIFGGTASVKHALMTLNDDDSVDWDLGWRGNMQFVIIQQTDPKIGNFGFEADNNTPGGGSLMPLSSPKIYNTTYVGSKDAGGMAAQKQAIGILRSGTQVEMGNCLFEKAHDFPIDIGQASAAQAKMGNIKIKNTLFFDNAKQTAWDDVGMMCDMIAAKANSGDCSERLCSKGTEPSCNDTSLDVNEGDIIMTNNNNMAMDAQLEDPTNALAPSFKPKAGSPVLNAANAMTVPAGFDAAPYLGAIGTDDWTLGWTAYPAN